MARVEELLTKGLLKGFAGGSEPKEIIRSPFSGKSNSLEIEGEGVYIDQWFGGELGGGQELVMNGEEIFTRVYAGGTIAEEKLKKMRTTKAEVLKFLSGAITTLGSETRLFQTVTLAGSDGWGYDYRILQRIPELSTTLAKETISVNGKDVFVHFFVLCPVS